MKSVRQFARTMAAANDAYHSNDNAEDCCPCCGETVSMAVNRVNTLFGTWWCAGCESATKRVKPKPIPMALGLRRYLKRVESGLENPFLSFSVKLGSNVDVDANITEYSQPLALTSAGKVRKGGAA